MTARGGAEVDEDQTETLLRGLTPADLPEAGDDGLANGYIGADRSMTLLTGLEKPAVGALVEVIADPSAQRPD